MGNTNIMLNRTSSNFMKSYNGMIRENENKKFIQVKESLIPI